MILNPKRDPKNLENAWGEVLQLVKERPLVEV